MLEFFEKMVLAGSGLMSMTREKAEKIVDKLIKKGQVNAKDKTTLVNRLLKGTKEFDENLDRKMREVAGEVLAASQKQLAALNKEISRISRELEAEKKKNKPREKKR